MSDRSSIDSLILAARQEGYPFLPESLAMEALRLWGLPANVIKAATSREEAVALAGEVGYPVVMKLVSPQVIHKSDVGAVLLNLASAEDAAAGFDRLLRLADTEGVDFTAVSIQRHISGGLEIVIGAEDDPQFGPVLMFGIGGILVEAVKDVSFRLVPVNLQDCLEMIDEIKSQKLLSGYRNFPAVDKKRLAEVMVGVSAFFQTFHDDISSIDLNPVLVHGSRCTIVDARLVLAQTGHMK